jgi:hypothetical protein
MSLQQVAMDELPKASKMMLIILQGHAFCLAGLFLRDFYSSTIGANKCQR